MKSRTEIWSYPDYTYKYTSRTICMFFLKSYKNIRQLQGDFKIPRNIYWYNWIIALISKGSPIVPKYESRRPRLRELGLSVNFSKKDIFKNPPLRLSSEGVCMSVQGRASQNVWYMISPRWMLTPQCSKQISSHKRKVGYKMLKTHAQVGATIHQFEPISGSKHWPFNLWATSHS